MEACVCPLTPAGAGQGACGCPLTSAAAISGAASDVLAVPSGSPASMAGCEFRRFMMITAVALPPANTIAPATKAGQRRRRRRQG